MRRREVERIRRLELQIALAAKEQGTAGHSPEVLEELQRLQTETLVAKAQPEVENIVTTEAKLSKRELREQERVAILEAQKRLIMRKKRKEQEKLQDLQQFSAAADPLNRSIQSYYQ